MSKVVSKHQQNEQMRTLTTFSRGMNRSLPPAVLHNEELVEARNMYYNPATGYLTTRQGLKKYSASAAPDKINSFINFVYLSQSKPVFSCEDNKLYTLDGSLNPVLIGTLSGTEVPTYTTVNDNLVIASGGVLQLYDGTTLSNTTSPTVNAISRHSKADTTRVVCFGNSTYKDRIYLSGSNDPSNWTTGATEADGHYIDVGYKDGFNVVAVEAYKGILFVSKRSNDDNAYKYKQYAVNINGLSTAWAAVEWSDTAAISQMFVSEINDNLYYISKKGTYTVDISEKYSDFALSPYGNAIDNEIRSLLASDGFAILDPIKTLWMIKPTKNNADFYCMDYTTNRWTYFTYAVSVLCGDVYAGKMILGGSDSVSDTDGYLYEYDDTLYTDDGNVVLYQLETKWFDSFDMFNEVMKERYLDYLGMIDGSMSMVIQKAGTPVYTKNITITSGWWTWAVVNVTLLANWTELLNKFGWTTTKDNNVVQGDFFGLKITIGSGLCAFARLRARSAISGRA